MKVRRLLLLTAVALVVLPSIGFAKDRSKPAKAKGHPGDWFPVNSYPADAKRNGQQGRVSVQLVVDRTGTPTACTVVASSGVPSLDKMTCDLAMTNAKFTPALDAKGQPAESNFALPGVRWELQDAPPIKLEGPWRAAGKLMIDQAGKLASCTDQNTGAVPDDLKFCLIAKGMPSEFGLFARGASTSTTSELLMESSLNIDGGPTLPMVFEQQGREAIQMIVVHFDVGVDGKVGNCQIEAQSGPVGDMCEHPPGPFLPIAKSQRITIKFAMSRPTVK